MKKVFLNACFTATMLLTVVSCGKYGYTFEDGYQEGNQQGTDPNETDLDYVDRSMYERARVYPGLVGEGVPLLKDHTISMDFKFKYVKAFDLKVNGTPQPIFSTGLYAPAGRNIKITVPAGVYGLTAQLGAHMDNLMGQDPLRRDPIIYTVKELFPGDNYVRNVYGGIIWIKAAVAINQPVDLTFTNAVRTSDFILGESNQTQWLQDVANNDVPWLELRGKRSIYTVPRSLVLQYRNDLKVAEVLAAWDEIYEEDFYKWMGLSEGNSDIKNSWPELPERGVLDIQPVVGYAHSGNPWVAQQDKHWFMQFSNIDYLIGDNDDGAWGTYHEIGHNYQQTAAWSWSGLGETTNNLFVFKGANRVGIPGMAGHGNVTSDIPKALAFAAEERGGKNFDDTPHSPFFKLTPFLQIFNKVIGKNGESGWDFMGFIYNRSRNSNYAFGFDEAKKDFFYRTLCEFTGRDYGRFMSAWGISVSSSARRDMRNTYPPMETRLWTYNPLTGEGGDEDLPPKHDLDRIDWLVAASSYGANESAPNGPASNVLDGNLNTFWISNTVGPVPPPHTLTIDMMELTRVKGFYINSRNAGSNIPRSVIIEISANGTSWTTLGVSDLLSGNFQIGNNSSRHEFTLTQSVDIKYFRYVFEEQSHANTNFIGVAEVGAFFDVD